MTVSGQTPTGSLGLAVLEEGIQVQGFNESSRGDKSLYAKGVSVISTDKSSVKINGVEQLTAAQIAATKGLNLIIFRIYSV